MNHMNMGIPFYFASLIKSHRGITRIVKHMEVDVLGIDGNCLIHRYLKSENPIQSVLDAIECITQLCVSKHVIVAMDGLVPYAKIVQQRYRRMGKKLEDIFDRNQISPGTPFMKELEQGIRARFPLFQLSSTAEPGEGEHKLFQLLRPLKPDTVCIYGLDADLILLCLQRHDMCRELTLLRESGEFNDPKLKEAEFALLSIPLLKQSLGIDVDQYMAMSILCFGNDFMPNLGMFSLREDGYSRALHIYENCGKPNLLTFEGRDVFLQAAGKEELAVLKERIKLRKIPHEKAILGKGDLLLSKRYGLHILDGVQDMKPVVEAFWRTFHWTLFYFQTNEVLDWDWYYPYPDAPLIQDILKEDETEFVQKKDLSFTIADQLSFILPAKSLRIAKRKVVFPVETYEKTREVWLKRHDWECDPRISLPWHPSQSLTEIVHL